MLTSQPISCPSCGEPMLMLAWMPPDEPAAQRVTTSTRRRSQHRRTRPSSSTPTQRTNPYRQFITEQLAAGRTMKDAARLWRARNNGSEVSQLADGMLGESKETEDDAAAEPEGDRNAFMAWALDPDGGSMTAEQAETKWRNRGDAT